MKLPAVFSALFFLGLATPQILADEAAEKVVDRAIAAHGGATNLARTKQMIRKSIGVIHAPGGEIQFTDEWTHDLPDRFRLQIDLGGAKTRMLLVVNGNMGWQVAGGTTQEMSKTRLAEVRDEMHVTYVAGLASLRSDRQISLASLPDVKLQDQTLAGVKVSRTGFGDVQLYFDKATGYLVRLTRKAAVGGLTMDKEYRWSEFKDFNGVKLPTQEVILQQDKKFSEVKAAIYSFPRVDERAFTKP